MVTPHLSSAKSYRKKYVLHSSKCGTKLIWRYIQVQLHVALALSAHCQTPSLVLPLSRHITSSVLQQSYQVTSWWATTHILMCSWNLVFIKQNKSIMALQVCQEETLADRSLNTILLQAMVTQLCVQLIWANLESCLCLLIIILLEWDVKLCATGQYITGGHAVGVVK